MTLTSSAGRLPVELLSMIADCLDIQHLLTLSHVCARWYAVARAHPTFWRDIRLVAVSDTALEFFQARIDSAAGRRGCLYINIPDDPFCDGIARVLIPAVTRSLGRVVQLSVDMHSTTAPHVISGLLEPAPLLESMGLRFFHHRKGQPPVTLPPNLLAGTCPRLVDLSLANVSFPVESMPVFQRVHSMTFHFRRHRVIPAGMFDHFPALQNLVLMGDSRLRVQSLDGSSSRMYLQALNELEFWLTRCEYDRILSSFPNVASARHVVCRSPREHVAQQLVDQLRGGALELNFLCFLDNLVHISLNELPTERVRSFVESQTYIVEDMPRSVIFAPHLLERYETLRIFAQLGHLAPHIEPLPQCRTLEIILDFNEERRFPSDEIGEPFRLPELRAVVVGNGQEHPTRIITVDAGVLRKYLSQLLGAAAKRSSLRLHGVAVTGDGDALFGDFGMSSK